MAVSKKIKELKIRKLVEFIRNNATDKDIYDYLSHADNLKGVDINKGEESEPWLTPITLCASRGHAKSVKKLLELGANPNTVNHYGMTPLMWAAYDGNVEMAKTLLDFNADIQIEKNTLENCYTLSFSEYRQEAFFFFIDNTIDINYLKEIEDKMQNENILHKVVSRPRVHIKPQDYIEQCFKKIYNRKTILEKVELKDKLENKLEYSSQDIENIHKLRNKI